MIFMDVTMVFEAIIQLVVAVLVVFLIPLVRKKFEMLDSEEFIKWTKIAVAAAEQLYSSAQGEAKREYVENFLKDRFDYDDTAIERAIEGAVKELHHALGIDAKGNGES